MKHLLPALLALIVMLPAAPLVAQNTAPPAPFAYQQLDDPALEEQATELMHSLRCITCQSQSIADSDAQMAGNMRHQVRTRIAAGESPEEVRAWLVQRYGDYISYDPVVSATTWPLFVIPGLLFLLGGALLLRRVGRNAPAEGTEA